MNTMHWQVPSNMRLALVLLLGIVALNTALEERNVDVGALCATSSDCGSDLLYCSSEGVCLCDEQRANFVYEYRHHFTIREPKCEVLPCTLAKEQDKNECNLRHASCLQHPDGDKDTGYCKCPGQQVGARRGTAFTLSYCKDVIHSNVGEKCISNLYICDVSKKLKCRDGTCECYDGHLFSFEKNICIREEEYIKLYGYDRLGSLSQYCSRSSDCHSGMFCKSKRCDCPNFCRSGEYIRASEVCYCAFDMTRLAYIIPSIVISILFAFFFLGLCYFNRKYNESLNTQSNLVLVHGRGTPAPGTPHYIYQEGSSPRQNLSLPSRPYSSLSGVDISQQKGNIDGDSPWSGSQSDVPQQLSSSGLSAQMVGGKYSYYPPPPYQLNELVAAEVVEAQMRQPSPVPSQYRDK